MNRFQFTLSLVRLSVLTVIIRHLIWRLLATTCFKVHHQTKAPLLTQLIELHMCSCCVCVCVRVCVSVVSVCVWVTIIKLKGRRRRILLTEEGRGRGSNKKFISSSYSICLLIFWRNLHRTLCPSASCNSSMSAYRSLEHLCLIIIHVHLFSPQLPCVSLWLFLYVEASLWLTSPDPPFLPDTCIAVPHRHVWWTCLCVGILVSLSIWMFSITEICGM